MNKGDQTRARILDTATRLFEERGYSATGLNDILTESEAPRGSLYHHFPGGKEQLAVEVVARHAELVRDGLTALLASQESPLRALSEGLALLACAGSAPGRRAGCPVTAIALEMAGESARLREATEAAFESWRSVIANRLVAAGMTRRKASTRARALVSAIVGAIVLSRAYGNLEPLDDVKKILPGVLEA